MLGIAQGILLLPFIKISGALEWLLATVIGRSAQWATLYVIALGMRGLVIDQSFVGLVLLFAMMLLTGVMSGVALAYPQAQVFSGLEPVELVDSYHRDWHRRHGIRNSYDVARRIPEHYTRLLDAGDRHTVGRGHRFRPLECCTTQDRPLSGAKRLGGIETTE